MKSAILGAFLFLAACTPTSGIEVRTVEVPVIRTVNCLSFSDWPNEPAPLSLMERPKESARALDIAVATILKWESHGAKTRALASACR